MAKDTKNTGGSLVVTSFITGLIGAAVGLLLAPQDGKKTREILRRDYKKVVDGINEFDMKLESQATKGLSTLTSGAKEIYSKVGQEASKIAKSVDEGITDVVSKGGSYANDITKTVTSAIVEIKK